MTERSTGSETTIVVGVDGSAMAPRVLAEAQRMARAHGGKLTVLRAVDVPTGLPATLTTPHPGGMSGMLIEMAHAELAELVAREVAPELVAAREVIPGSAWKVLCDAASALAADYVVIGSQGYSLLDRVLGTTAARVVNLAPCPVLVVR